MKALEELRAGIPEYAKDLKLNLQSVLTQSSLDETQLGVAGGDGGGRGHPPALRLVERGLGQH